jgi:hypothetical protein
MKLTDHDEYLKSLPQDFQDRVAAQAAVLLKEELARLKKVSKPKPESSYIVTARNDGRWSVKRANAVRASSVHSSQAEALKAGRRLADKARSELKVVNRDALLQEA